MHYTLPVRFSLLIVGSSLLFSCGQMATAPTAVLNAQAVSFDSVSGTGFVGKGDVQLAFAWNNAQLQKNAAGVIFNYATTDRYDVECEWDTTTGSGKVIHHDITVPRHTRVNAVVTYDARIKNQITGFTLRGLGDVITEGTTPVMGGSCPGRNPGTITNVIHTQSTGGLNVTYGDTTVALPNTPTL